MRLYKGEFQWEDESIPDYFRVWGSYCYWDGVKFIPDKDPSDPFTEPNSPYFSFTEQEYLELVESTIPASGANLKDVINKTILNYLVNSGKVTGIVE